MEQQSTSNFSPTSLDEHEQLANAFLQNHGLTLSYDMLPTAAKERLCRLLTGDNTNSDVTFESEWERFVSQVPAWREADDRNCTTCSVFWSAHPHISGLKVIRRQLSGLCYIHAPAVLQHYLVAINTGNLGHKMIDVAKFLQMHMRKEALAEYIEHDKKGGFSTDFLRDITKRKDLSLEVISLPKTKARQQAKADEIVEWLKFKKPGLVSNFVVTSDFHTSQKVQFHGTRQTSGHDVGKHAMLIVGFRCVEGGDFMFLLQNWWKDRHFIEVSTEYLASCDCTISFVDPDQDSLTEIPQDWPCVSSAFAETAVDAGGERLEEF